MPDLKPTTQRQLRRLVGPAAAKQIREHEIRINSHAAILRRGLVGRLKWLLTGK